MTVVSPLVCSYTDVVPQSHPICPSSRTRQPIILSRNVVLPRSVCLSLVTHASFVSLSSRLINDPNAQDEAPGGTFTIGGTNSTLFQGDIDFVNLPSNVQPSFWLLPVTGTDSPTLSIIYGILTHICSCWCTGNDSQRKLWFSVVSCHRYWHHAHWWTHGCRCGDLLTYTGRTESHRSDAGVLLHSYVFMRFLI